LKHSIWLKNRTTTRALNDNKTPYELLYGMKPNLLGLPEWGTKVFVLKEDRGKLKLKVDEGHWVSYSDESKGHQIDWPGKHRVTVECNVTFDESVLVPTNVQVEGGNIDDSPSNQHIAMTTTTPPPALPQVNITPNPAQTAPDLPSTSNDSNLWMYVLKDFEAPESTDNPKPEG
ncbi:hypothetical protein K439DRAFT_1333671, partial [Ramaria rubella]